MFLCSAAFWLSSLCPGRKYALIYFPSRILKLTAQRLGSLVVSRPFASPCPTLCPSVTLSPAPPPPGPQALTPDYPGS